jgi:hypothetical protein
MFMTAQLVFVILMLAAEKSRDTFIAPVRIGLALFTAELTGGLSFRNRVKCLMLTLVLSVYFTGRYCMLSNAGSLSIYHCANGPPTA